MSRQTVHPVRSAAILLGFVLWLIINIRVEAGMGTTFERVIDGLFGGVLVLVSLFGAWLLYSCRE
jgi:hypothetical protein